MYEAKCKKCDAVYCHEEQKTPESFECLCGCNEFLVTENTLVVS